MKTQLSIEAIKIGNSILYKLQWSKLLFNLKYNVTTHDEILKRNILEEAT